MACLCQRKGSVSSSRDVTSHLQAQPTQLARIDMTIVDFTTREVQVDIAICVVLPCGLNDVQIVCLGGSASRLLCLFEGCKHFVKFRLSIASINCCNNKTELATTAEDTFLTQSSL